MSERVDKFCDGLRDKLNGIEARLTALKAAADAKAQESQQKVEGMLDSAQARVESHRTAIEAAKANAAGWAEEKKSKFDQKVAEWKNKRQLQFLSARADRAEGYAAAMFDLAVAAADEAELAMLEASLARLDAEAAA